MLGVKYLKFSHLLFSKLKFFFPQTKYLQHIRIDLVFNADSEFGIVQSNTVLRPPYHLEFS